MSCIDAVGLLVQLLPCPGLALQSVQVVSELMHGLLHREDLGAESPALFLL